MVDLRIRVEKTIFKEKNNFHYISYVIYCGRPFNLWSCSLLLDLHIYSITKKASSLLRQYKFPIFWHLHFPLLRGSFSPKAWNLFIRRRLPSSSDEPVRNSCANAELQAHRVAGHYTPESLRCHQFCICDKAVPIAFWLASVSRIKGLLKSGCVRRGADITFAFIAWKTTWHSRVHWKATNATVRRCGGGAISAKFAMNFW